MKTQSARPAWVEIDLDRLSHNIQAIISKITHQVKLLAVVKANAYGHGAIQVAKTAVLQGAYMLGVATVEEGVELRRAGIMAPILILGAIDEMEAAAIVEYVLTPTLFTLPAARAVHSAAQRKQSKVQFHLRIDTTGGSLGIAIEAVSEFLDNLKELPGLELTGIYTHLYAAYGQDDNLVRHQIRQFDDIVAKIKKLMSQSVIVHAASTPGIVNWPEAYYDMVRAGNLLYGLAPEIAGEHGEQLATGAWGAVAGYFKPVMQLKARIVNVRKISPGKLWLYGYEQVIDKETMIATVPLGYADGFALAYLSNSRILIGGRKVPVVGKVVMDCFMVDVTGVAGVAIGDEVIIWGEQAGIAVSVDDIVLKSRIKMVQEDGKTVSDTRISRASLCLLSNRLPRLYITDETVSSS